MRQAPQAGKRLIEYAVERVETRRRRAPLYCCRVDFGWEGVLRDMEEVG